MVLKINQENYGLGLCHWCICPTVGQYVISRQDLSLRWISDYACEKCASGWQEIADKDNDLII